MVDTQDSASEIALVRAARSTRRKNTTPMILPIPMLANTLGRVMNISEGPAFSFSGSPLKKENTAGIIIRPARKAIAVSKTSI